MSKVDELRVIVTEKMTIAVREILAVVEKTVAGYDKEVFLLKRELNHHKRQLDAILQPQVNLYRIAVDVVGAPDVLLSGSTNGDANEFNFGIGDTKINDRYGDSETCPGEGGVDGQPTKVSREETLLELEESNGTLADLPSDSSVSCSANREDSLRDNAINEAQNTTTKRRRRLRRRHRSSPIVTDSDSDNNDIEKKGEFAWKSDKNKKLKDTNFQTTACDNRPITSVLEEEPPSENEGPSKITAEHENISSIDSAAQSEDDENDTDWKPEKHNQVQQHSAITKKNNRKKRREQNVSSENCDTCKVCGYLFKSKSILTKHALRHLDNPKGICGVCGQQLESSEELKRHLETHHKLHQCDTCRRIFLTFVTFQRHIIKCQKEKPSSVIETLKKKKNIDRKDKPHKCDTCSQSFRFNAQLHVHHRKHSGEKPFHCDICGKSLSSYRNFCLHKLIHTGEKNYSCKQCGKLFSCSKFLKTHEKIHSERQRNFLCDICSKTFYTKNELKIHLKRHEEMHIKCPVCGKLLKGDLATHMGVHTGKKPFSCKQCGMQFRLRSHLKSHMGTHLGIKPFLCTVCGHTFGRSDHLNLHMRSHTGHKPYKCTLCDKAFTQSHCLKTHMKSHQTEDSAEESLA